MPDYVSKVLDRLQYSKPKRPQYAPHRLSVPALKKTMAPDSDGINLLDQKSTNKIQSIVGTNIYYAWSVDPTMLWEINEILRVQSRPTRRMLLYYEAT